MNNSKLDIIYQVTYFIEPPNKGLLLIEPQVLNDNEYKLLKSEITNSNHLAPINYGETKNKGVVFTSYTSEYFLVNDIIEAIFNLAVDLTKTGINDTIYNSYSREDLIPCLENSKCYILSKKLDKPKCLSKYFSENEILYPNKLSPLVKSIVSTNKKTIKDKVNDDKLFNN